METLTLCLQNAINLVSHGFVAHYGFNPFIRAPIAFWVKSHLFSDEIYSKYLIHNPLHAVFRVRWQTKQ